MSRRQEVSQARLMDDVCEAPSFFFFLSFPENSSAAPPSQREADCHESPPIQEVRARECRLPSRQTHAHVHVMPVHLLELRCPIHGRVSLLSYPR